MPKAAVCRGLNEPLSIEEVDLEAPKAGEVKVKMGASGVCHSDLSVINGTLFGSYPIVLGHEGAGVIEEVGDGVEGLAVGDHVVISWVPQCGQCFFCKQGQGFLCEFGAGGHGRRRPARRHVAVLEGRRVDPCRWRAPARSPRPSSSPPSAR